jgi:hypothetical protein
MHCGCSMVPKFSLMNYSSFVNIHFTISSPAPTIEQMSHPTIYHQQYGDNRYLCTPCPPSLLRVEFLPISEHLLHHCLVLGIELIICGITSHSTYDLVSTPTFSNNTMVLMEKNSSSTMNMTSSSSSVIPCWKS